MTIKTSHIIFLKEQLKYENSNITTESIVAVYQDNQVRMKSLQCYTKQEQHCHGSVQYFKNLPLATREEYKDLLKHMEASFKDTRFVVIHDKNSFFGYNQ